MATRQEKRFYGAVTVSERGQIVIPIEARRDFKIKTGDKLLVFGDLSQGIAIVKASLLIEGMADLMSIIQSVELDDEEEDLD